MHARKDIRTTAAPGGRYTEPTRGIRVPASPSPAPGARDGVAEFFQPAGLDDYTLRQRFTIRAAAFACQAIIALIGPTLRWEFRGGEHLDAIYRSGRLPIYCFYHNRILATTWFWRRRDIVVMTSKSFDGEWIARSIQRFGYGAARGSSTRGAVGALIGLNRAMRAGYEVSFTVDGPKGPLYFVKPGPGSVARKTGNPILPVSLILEKHWEVGSWDRFQIPKPFSRAMAVVAPPIDVARDADDEGLETARHALQHALDELRRLYDGSTFHPEGAKR
jgi:lysophospholipid acyltransferase (LPLAT)-like uncharacterized protein